ncbi:MAG TPA: ABC transporter substrate-binding protein [Rhodospirillales bacterium]|nr:ABC transporter substrate-binding protein [Rhodospirillales bacterium]
MSGRAIIFGVLGLFFLLAPAQAGGYIEPPYLEQAVAAGQLPPLEERLPETPMVVDMTRPGLEPGRYGGVLRMLMSRAKDIKMMVVYGYARLVGYDKSYKLLPDILEKVDVKEQRIFTLHLRKRHKWSDGAPFTSEDFRYYWEDIALNGEMSPTGPPGVMRIDGEAPLFEVIDETTVRFTWKKSNPFFLPSLAAARPNYIYMPSHYLKQFHKRYADADKLEKMIKDLGQRNWVSLHFQKGRQYKNNNPDLPSLQPWVLATKPPADRFVFKRNPYYHRLDNNGRQLPYIDEAAIIIANKKLIAAKAGSGEVDLQARSLQFSNYAFLKQGEKRNGFKVRLWETAKGAHMALYPNLNATDPVWRKLLRNVDFRRALSLAINRHEINQVIYFGLAREGANTMLPKSPLYKSAHQTKWAHFDLAEANRLLDGLGLVKRDGRGLRLLPDGRSMEIIVETAGEDTEQSDVLELIHDGWLKAGVKLYTKPLQREVFRNRIFAGSTLISVWVGLENGVASFDSSPHELAPTSQQQLQWPKWGLYFESNGKRGEAPDMEAAKELAGLNKTWRNATGRKEKEEVWRKMLAIHADQVFSIGLISGVLQPVVVSNRLHNVPENGIYNWEPGAHFGVHRPDAFWFSEK